MDKLTLDASLERLFPWLTRIGAGRKFGSLPIGWYQIHQCKCLDILQARMGGITNQPMRCKGGMIQAQRDRQWHDIMSARQLFNEADNAARKG